MTSESQDKPGGSPPFFYFVDGTKYESTQSTITGAAIKAKIPNFDTAYLLFLEVQGQGADQLINDDTSVSLEIGHGQGGPKRFHIVPPATFGRR